MKKEYVVIFSHMGDRLYSVGDKRTFEKEAYAKRLLEKGLIAEVVATKEKSKPKIKAKQEK